MQSRPSLAIETTSPQTSTALSRFEGCWHGVVDGYDTFAPLSDLARNSSFHTIPITYKFCYRRDPRGSDHLDLTKLELDDPKVRVVAFKLEIFNLNERTGTASFRAHATAVQYLHPLWLFRYRIQDDSDVQGDLLAVKNDVIKMKATQTDKVNGSDFSIATIHCDFRRVTDQASKEKID